MNIEKVGDRRGDVLASLAQGRNAEVGRVQPKEQILAEPAGTDLLVEGRVGRDDDFRKQEAAYTRAWYAGIAREAWGWA